MSASNATPTVPYVSGTTPTYVPRTLQVHMTPARMTALAKIKAGLEAGGTKFTNPAGVIEHLIDTVSTTLV